MKPDLLNSRTLYSGRVFDITVDSIRDGDVEYTREVVIHKGSAVIMPIFDDGTVALVRQYRHAAGKYLLELPAGTLERGEDPLAGARRELEEEIGVTAANIEKVCEFFVSPGFLTEKMYLYAASGLTATAQRLEADEILTIQRFSISELRKMIAAGQIEDAKTIIGVTMAAERHREPR